MSNEHKVSHQNETHESEHQEQPTPLETCHAELSEWKERCLRVTADFDNYKRRQQKDLAQWQFSLKKDLLSGLLSVIDSFDRAIEEHEKMADHPEFKAWFKGFELIDKEFVKYLDSVGIKEIAQHQTFDPELHEAVMTVAADQQTGTIVAVLQKGYMVGDQVLRPAKVSIAQ